jgi:hypothetical protein
LFSGHKRIKVGLNNKRKTGKFTDMWKLNHVLHNNQGVKEEIPIKIRKYLQTNENTPTICTNL